MPDFGNNDTLLRECLFGPLHPRAAGFAGTTGAFDSSLPGFGAHGTAGAHVFDTGHPAFRRIKALIATRKALRPLRRGRQYRRTTAISGDSFAFQGAGELLAWSRLLNEQEIIMVVNPNGAAGRGYRVELDRQLRRPGSTVRVFCDTSRLGAAGADALGGGAVLPVQALGNDRVFVEVGVLGASEVMVLV